jgi:hypothetical protein|tara:strand:- start:298 stop:468 length:171 start_codon:yes stop_codon:yes gene_type:complete
MKVGDLVRAPHWDESHTAIVISTKRLETGIVTVLGSFGWELDQVARDLEIINSAVK